MMWVMILRRVTMMKIPAYVADTEAEKYIVLTPSI